MNSVFFWAFVGQYLNVALKILSTVILARLLTPSEIGVFAIGASILAIGLTFRTLGIQQYLIREANLSDEKIENAVFLSFVTTALLSAILFFGANFIGDFYNNDSLKSILYLLALSVLVLPFGLVAESKLKKDLHFKQIAGIETVATIAFTLVAIVLAYLNFGAFSLAIATLVNQLTLIVGMNFCNKQSRIFLPIPTVNGLKEIGPAILRIGTSNILMTLGQQGEPLVVGKVINESAVAMLDKSKAVIEMLNLLVFTAIEKVLTPWFSQENINNKTKFKDYLSLIDVTLSISWPFLFYLAWYSEVIVITLYGNNWYQAVELVPYACIGTAIFNVSRYFNNLMISLGYDSYLLRTTSILMLLRIIVLILSAPYGLIPMVIALQSVVIIRLIITTYILIKIISISIINSLFILVLKNLLVTVMATAPIFFVEGETELARLFICLPLSLFLWLIGLLLVKSPLAIFLKEHAKCFIKR